MRRLSVKLLLLLNATPAVELVASSIIPTFLDLGKILLVFSLRKSIKWLIVERADLIYIAHCSKYTEPSVQILMIIHVLVITGAISGIFFVIDINIIHLYHLVIIPTTIFVLLRDWAYKTSKSLTCAILCSHHCFLCWLIDR